MTNCATPSGSPDTTEAPEPKLVTIPDDLVGMNAKLAYEKLQDLGFEKITPSSTDDTATVVVMMQNWTVTGVEPGPGTEVDPDSTIILKMSKD